MSRRGPRHPFKLKLTQKRDAETDTSDIFNNMITDSLKPLIDHLAEEKINKTVSFIANLLVPPKKKKRKEKIIDDEDEGENGNQEGKDEDEDEDDDMDLVIGDDDDDDSDYQDPEEVEKKYFENLSEEKQNEIKKIEETLKQMNQDTDKPTKYQILELPIDIKTKYTAMNKYESMEMLEPGSSEFGKIYKWLDVFLRIPFGKYINLPVSESKNSITEINTYLNSVRKELDSCVYGNSEPKEIILEILAQWISNPESIAVVLGFEGPPGTGKTSLARHGIAKALNRPFFQINLGGSNEGSSLGGSNMVYEGSSYGEIVKILLEAQCMNPVIYFDELDKVSKAPQGKEIIGLLTHLTDYSQNNTYKDKFLDVDLDLSKALFIFSYNDPEKIDPVLKDRLKIIRMPGYNQEEKRVICKDYVVPAVLKNIGNNLITFNDEILTDLIRVYSPEISGIRDIRRIIEKIAMRINYLRYYESEKYPSNQVINVNKQLIEKCISGIKRAQSLEFNSMYL